jgi:hypothetical protein
MDAWCKAAEAVAAADAEKEKARVKILVQACAKAAAERLSGMHQGCFEVRARAEAAQQASVQQQAVSMQTQIAAQQAQVAQQQASCPAAGRRLRPLLQQCRLLAVQHLGGLAAERAAAYSAHTRPSPP